MSILLEALRKSEKSRRTQEVPDIHADDQSAPDSESLQTGPLVLLLVAALFVSGWFVWHQYRLPAGSYQPPVELADNKTRPVTTPVAGEDGTPQAKPAGQQRTPVETYQQTAEETPQPEAGEQRPGKPDPSRTDRRPTGQQPASGQQPAADKPVEVSRKEEPPHQPAPISYWELPDAIRADVPEIRFSVLVYANNPVERFVLINGQRLGEGDNSQPGLVVEEIRRDGVVFSYRVYRFLVER